MARRVLGRALRARHLVLSFSVLLTAAPCFARPRFTALRAEPDEVREAIRQMRAREMKRELEAAGVNAADLFEKEELAERLWQLRTGAIQGAPAAEPAADVAPEPDPKDPKAAVSDAQPADFLEACRAMRVKELRTELGQRGISWADCLDKDELVQRLAQQLAKEAAFSSHLKPGVVTKITGPELQDELKDSATPLLLDVYATWCGPCKMMEPQMEAAAKKLGERVRMAKMDSDQESTTSSELRVNGLPTVILFDRAGKEVARQEGALMESQILDLVKPYL